MRDFPLTLPRTIFNIKPAAVSVNLEAEINALIAAAKVTNNLSTTASLNFASTATLVCSDLTIALVGAVVGDVVSLGIPAAAVPAGGSYTAWVSAADVVTVRFCNNTAGAIDPAVGTFKVTILK